MTPRDRRTPQSTWRLTFSFDGETVTLDSKQKLTMVPPPSDPLHPAPDETGFWYELRDRQGTTHYRRITESPITLEPLVRRDDLEQPIARAKRDDVPVTVFILLVPDIRGADILVLYASPSSTDEGPPKEEGIVHAAAEEFARFDLAK